MGLTDETNFLFGPFEQDMMVEFVGGSVALIQMW